LHMATGLRMACIPHKAYGHANADRQISCK
jgi:hypothetical protein